MTSTVTSKGQTVVPKALRDRFNIKSGATLDWQEDGQSLRVIKLEPRKAGSNASLVGWHEGPIDLLSNGLDIDCEWTLSIRV